VTEATVDDRFYQATRAKSLGERMLIAARDRIYADFLRVAAPRPEDSLLDVGVSDVVNDGANLLSGSTPTPAGSPPRGWARARTSGPPFPRWAMCG
jgi:hypothetical protein